MAAIASVSATEAIKLIVGQGELNHGIIHFDLWYNTFEQFESSGPRPDCPACQQRNFEFLNQEQGLSDLANRLAEVSRISARNEYLLRFHVDSYEITLFADARAIIKGTEDESVARGLYAKYIGV